MIPFEEMVYSSTSGKYVPLKLVAPGDKTGKLSGTELRRRLREGLEFPPWFSYPNVIEELRRKYLPRHQQGFTLFFTGLSEAGKSTIAKVLQAKFLEVGGRPATLLDGDIVRKNLSSELGFSREHCDLNILRIGFVANEVTKNGGIAICAPIAPYSSTPRRVRERVTENGTFIEVYVSTSLAVCEKRDRKGVYPKARRGLIRNFTGIDDPYEVPKTPEIVLDTTHLTPEEAAGKILAYFKRERFFS